MTLSPPIFGSPILDRLTRVHPVVPVLIFLPAIVTFAVIGFGHTDVAQGLVMFTGGYAFWTLNEYWIHRGLFHLEPASGLGARLHWMIHGVHHDHPDDPNRLVMPPAVSLPLAAMFFYLFDTVFGLPTGWLIAAGFFTGYLVYDMVHFALHHARARGRIARLLRELHMRHHFEDDRCGFAVSAPWWDVVFRTYAPRARRNRRG